MRFELAGLLAPLGAICCVLFVACGPSVMSDEERGWESGSARQALYGGDLGRRLGTALATGSTCGGTSDYHPTCIYGPAAPDVVYLWTAPLTDTFSFSTAGSSFDTVLEVRPYNNTSQTLGCNDDVGAGVQQSELQVALTAGQTVQVIVDSYGSQCGSYRLDILGLVCGSGCSSPPSSCHQSTGTCTASGCYYPPKPAGSSCSDGNACTGSDRCDGAGQCVAGPQLLCNSPPNGCHYSTGTCQPSRGCVYTSRCSANQYCFNNSVCCSGAYPDVSTSSKDESPGEGIYMCPAYNSSQQ